MRFWARRRGLRPRAQRTALEPGEANLLNAATPSPAATAYIEGDAEGLRAMDDAQRAAYFDVSSMRILLSDAKELVYWALDMDKTFVPRLAATYNDQLDKWRMAHVRKEAKKRAGEGNPPVAEGVIGARYFADLQ